MAKAIISRRGGGSGYATITFNGVSALKRTGAAALVLPRYGLAATTVGNYALFGGGYDNSYRVAVDAYNTSLTRATRTSLSQERANLAATTVGNYALFGGGMSRSGTTETFYSTVDAYDTSLTRSTPTALSVARRYLAATTVGDYALFGGGGGNTGILATVDAYNTSLISSIPEFLVEPRRSLVATTVGNYALFGGGIGPSSTVDAYYVNNKVQVYPGTIYKLGSMSTESTSSTMQEIETTAPITGYIKIKDATIK